MTEERVEMSRKEITSGPPIFDNPTVITLQPQRETTSSRRPIPISTADWVSTPRSQLNALFGTQFLAGVEQLEIQRTVDLSTLLGMSERKNQYRVKVPKAETIFLAIESCANNEENLSETFGGFTFNVLDQAGETAFVIKKNSAWKYAPWPIHKITVESAYFIGTVEQNFTLLGPSFTVYDESRKPLCQIHGPNVCICCMYKESQFQIVSMDGSHQIASLMHQWDNTILDYALLLTFPVDMDIKLKGLLLGASFLMEYLYFRSIKRTTR